MQIAVVVSGEDEAALAHPRQEEPSGVECGQHDVAQLGRDLHEPPQLVDGHLEHHGPRIGDPLEEGSLAHEHAQLAHEVALLHDEDDPVFPTIDQ